MFEGVGTVGLIIYVILLLLTLLILTFLALLVHSGLFRAIDEVGTGKPPIGQIIIAYKFSKGPYKEAGQFFTEAAFIAPDNKALGIYYDDPHKVESSQLRYAVGSILAEGSTPVNEDMVKNFTEKGFKILHLPEVTYAVQTKFPHVTTLSILIAVHKAYPRLKEYIEERKLCAYPCIEYYDGKSIHFMAPLSKQDEFFVPECDQDVCGDQPTVDSTMLNTSHSVVEESEVSHDITHSSVDDDSVQDREEHSLLDASQSEAPLEGIEEDVNVNANNSQKGKVGAKDGNDDEQASDDSSSSFEVLKHEPAE